MTYMPKIKYFDAGASTRAIDQAIAARRKSMEVYRKGGLTLKANKIGKVIQDMEIDKMLILERRGEGYGIL